MKIFLIFCDNVLDLQRLLNRFLQCVLYAALPHSEISGVLSIYGHWLLYASAMK